MGLKRPDFENIDQVFGQALLHTMRLFDFEQAQIERMLDWSQHNIYTKTSSRSVLGSMNDIAFHVEHHITYAGRLEHIDLDALLIRINQIPFKAIGYEYPRVRLQELLAEGGSA